MEVLGGVLVNTVGRGLTLALALAMPGFERVPLLDALVVTAVRTVSW